MEVDICPLCVKPVLDSEPSSRLTEKGVASLINANRERQDLPINFIVNSKIHKDCRVQYCHKRLIKKHIESKSNNNISSQENKNIILRSSDSSFCFKTDCFFCGQNLPEIHDFEISTVESLNIHESLLGHCEERGDSWGDSVQARLLSVHDLVAAGNIFIMSFGYSNFTEQSRNLF